MLPAARGACGAAVVSMPRVLSARRQAPGGSVAGVDGMARTARRAGGRMVVWMSPRGSLGCERHRKSIVTRVARGERLAPG